MDRRVQRLGVIGALCLAASAVTLAVIAFLLAREAPAWWRTVDPTDPGTVELAERVEQAIVGVVHRNRPPGEPWTIAISASQANAWLNVKLPKWLASRNARWPDQIGQVQMQFADGRISIGVRIDSDIDEQIVAATVHPDLRDDGGLWLTQPSTNAGRLDLPSGWTISRLAAWLPPEIRRRQMTGLILDALRQRAPALTRTWINLEDGRRVRLVGVRIEDNRLVLTCLTELPGAVTAQAE